MEVESTHKAISDVSNKVHPQCVVCSSGNVKGLHLEFIKDGENGVKSYFECDDSFQGYPGVLHGGVISSILDGAMGNCIFARRQAAVTVEMKTRFRHPVFTNQKMTVKARIVRKSHPLYLLEAEIIQDEKVKATAEGKFYDQPELAEKLEFINE